MEVYLIRHTITAAGSDVCYGQADVPLDMDSFSVAIPGIREQLPATAGIVYSSPLLRCSVLATELMRLHFTDAALVYDSRLKELNFGDWEQKKWAEICQSDLDNWMKNFTTVKVPGGESNGDLHDRVAEFWKEIVARGQDCCIVTHAGVIRSILSIVRQTELRDAFTLYPVRYGEVIGVRV